MEKTIIEVAAEDLFNGVPAGKWDGEKVSQLRAALTSQLSNPEIRPNNTDIVVDPNLPRIRINDREMRDVSDDAIKALAKHSELFVRGGVLVRVLVDEKGRASIETVTVDILCAILARAANFYVARTTEKGKTVESISNVPVRLARDILSIGVWPQFPPLEGVIESPTMRPDGSILSEPGYDESIRLYYQPAIGFVLPPVKLNPDRQDIDAALTLLYEAVVDFPFDSEASRDNALAAMITPVVRECINGATPIAISGSSQQSAGKTMVAQAVGQISTGAVPEPSPAPDTKEEWRKTVTAQLSTGRPIILLDNVMGLLEDGALAAVATSTTWSDRLLGHNDKRITLPAKACWMVTGNNVRVGGDLVTRCYLINLDPKTSRPQDRDDFKHPNIEEWIRDNRGELLRAILTLARAWHVAGRPKPTCPRTRYSAWRHVVGGILEYAGAKNFLGNLRQFQESADSEGPAWEAFLGKLAEIFHGQAVTPAMVYSRFSASDELADFLPDELAGLLGAVDDQKAKNKFSQALGYAFRQKNGKRFGDTQAHVLPDRRTKGAQYWRFMSS